MNAKKDEKKIAPEELDLESLGEEKPEEKPKESKEYSKPPMAKKKVVVEQKSVVPTKEELDKAGAITITQFIRSEALGLLKQGFAIYCQNKGVGGRKPRAEWMALFNAYKSAPVAPPKKRRGN